MKSLRKLLIIIWFSSNIFFPRSITCSRLVKHRVLSKSTTAVTFLLLIIFFQSYFLVWIFCKKKRKRRNKQTVWNIHLITFSKRCSIPSITTSYTHLDRKLIVCLSTVQSVQICILHACLLPVPVCQRRSQDLTKHIHTLVRLLPSWQVNFFIRIDSLGPREISRACAQFCDW